MKPTAFFPGLLALLLVLSACAPAAASTPATAPPMLTRVPITESAPASAPTLQTVAVNAAPTIGSTLTWFDTSTLVYVPEGEFIMGADEPKGQDFVPAHIVTLNDFWIYRTKVTNEMYDLCVSVGQCSALPASDLTVPVSTLSGSFVFVAISDHANSAIKDFPVTNVTWDQANTYCQWAGGRLPTEAEWEKTARGTASQIYPWGDASPSCDLLNFGGCGGFLSSVLDHPDGMSENEALDMAGNAYEWVGDWYQADYYTRSPSANPAGPETGSMRSIRGSSFETDADSLQTFQRTALSPRQSRMDLGFRCVIDDPAIFAPMCSVPAQIAANTSLTPQAGQSVSGSSMNSTMGGAIDLDKNYPMQSSSYCIDANADLGGATVKLDNGQLWKTIGANCGLPTTIVWDWGSKGPGGASINGGMVEYYFSRPEGLPLSLKVGLICPPKQPPAQTPVGVPASCALGYTLQANGLCLYTGTSNQAGSVACPAGYSYSQQSQCCTINPAQTGNAPSQYPACGPGNLFDSMQNVCYKPSNAKSTPVQSIKNLTFHLGVCQDKKPNDTDKPQQPPPPTPCVIDPATGACH